MYKYYDMDDTIESLHYTVYMQSLMLKQKLRKMTASGRFAGGVINSKDRRDT